MHTHESYSLKQQAKAMPQLFFYVLIWDSAVLRHRAGCSGGSRRGGGGGGGLRGLKTPPSARPAMNKLTYEYLIT